MVLPTLDDKTAIEQLYLKLLGRPLIRRTGCNDCYRDALIEIKIHIKHKSMKYSLKKGALIYDHVTNNYYTDDNLTDEVAGRILAADPSMINQFASYPSEEPKLKTDDKTTKSSKSSKTSKIPAPKKQKVAPSDTVAPSDPISDTENEHPTE